MAIPYSKDKITERLFTIVALIFAVAYVLYCGIYWGRLAMSGDPYAMVAIAILLPHFIATGVGLVLTALALFLGVAWWNLAAGIVYIVAIAFFPAYWFFLIVPAIFSFIGFVSLRRRAKGIAPLTKEAVAQKLARDSVDAEPTKIEKIVDAADAVPAAAMAAPVDEKNPEGEADKADDKPAEDEGTTDTDTLVDEK